MRWNLIALGMEGKRNKYSKLFGALFKEVFASDLQSTYCGEVLTWSPVSGMPVFFTIDKLLQLLAQQGEASDHPRL